MLSEAMLSEAQHSDAEPSIAEQSERFPKEETMPTKAKKMEQTKISVVLEGWSDIMFNRFIDHSKEKRPAEQKLYLSGDNEIVLPAENIYSFLFGEAPAGCAKKFEGKQGRNYISVGMSHLFIDPALIPITDDKGKPIKFNGWKGAAPLHVHPSSPFYVCMSGGRTKLGSNSIKQEAQPRPVLKMPWRVAFNITLLKNNLIEPVKLENWFNEGGTVIALGTYRPRYGRFQVAEWEEA